MYDQREAPLDTPPGASRAWPIAPMQKPLLAPYRPDRTPRPQIKGIDSQALTRHIVSRATETFSRRPLARPCRTLHTRRQTGTASHTMRLRQPADKAKTGTLSTDLTAFLDESRKPLRDLPSGRPSGSSHHDVVASAIVLDGHRAAGRFQHHGIQGREGRSIQHRFVQRGAHQRLRRSNPDPGDGGGKNA